VAEVERTTAPASGGPGLATGEQTRRARVLIFVVSFNAERFIESVLNRIPEDVWSSQDFDVEVLVIDDQSTDRTFDKAAAYATDHPQRRITVLFNPTNQGYGGNQKIGYHYAVENQFDVVVLLHGDGQYAPELLADMIGPITGDRADVVLGSRMLRKHSALKGGMPLYKWVGNQILTAVQNRLLGAQLAEFHTGYRAYRVAALASVPFEQNSDYFDFDTDILIQLLDTSKRIVEIPIPTYYGEEISAVNGVKYAALILRSSLLSRFVRWGIFYHPKFDYYAANDFYSLKLGYDSSHQFALNLVRQDARVLDIGCGPGLMARELAHKGAQTISIDRFIGATARQYSVRSIEVDLDEYDFCSYADRIDTILVLDIIEHLKAPEEFLARLRNRHSNDSPEVIVTTGNIAFLPVRLALLLGWFNYGKRGILDLTHTRLFTFASLRRLLTHQGFDIFLERGLPAPFPEALGNRRFARLLVRLNALLIRIGKGLFSYQIAVVARPRPTLADLLRNAYTSAGEKRPGTRPADAVPHLKGSAGGR
jgi:glycosyltransferase involved in cell wall biosynthesis